MGTLLALFIVFALHWWEFGRDVVIAYPLYLGAIFAIAATVFVVLPTFLLARAWGPLQNSEQRITPRVIEIFKSDRSIRWTSKLLYLFALISYVGAVDLIALHIVPPLLWVSAWVLMVGISLDLLWHLIKRYMAYLDPLYVTSVYAHNAQKCIQNDEEVELCQWIDALSEVAVKAVQRTNVSLCNQVCNELNKITRLFLESSKSIVHRAQDSETKALGITDKVSFTLFYILQRLEMIDDKAVEHKLEPVCSHLVTLIGKIVVESAKLDISLASYPLPFLGRFALKAQEHGLKEVGAKATLTLVEVARMILSEIDVKYLELQEPFFTLINQMNEIAKEMFRHDKSISLKILTQPFKDLRTLFEAEKMASHPDTAPILQQIDRVLAEYDALEAVMRAIPPIPNI